MMADQRITELTPAPFVANDDLLAIVRDPNAVASTRRATFDQVASMLSNNPNLVIAEARLATGSVTNSKLAADAITGDKIAENEITGREFRNSVQRSVVGRPGTGTGAVSDIVVGDNRVLGRTTGNLGSVQVQTDMIANSAVTSAKIGANEVGNTELRQSAAHSVIGRAAGTPGNPTDIVIGTNRLVGRGTGGLGGVSVATDMILDNAVTSDKILNNAVTSDKILANAVGASEFRNSVQRSVVGRPGTGTGAVSDIVVGDNRVLGRTTGNLSGVQITSAMIGTNQVTNSEIASNTILAGNIANGAVTEAKLDSDQSAVSPSAPSWSTGILCKRIGNTVWLSGTAGRTGGNVTGLSTAGTIPTGFRPGTAPTDRSTTTSSGNIRTFRVTTGGALQINGSNTGEVTTIDICYLV
jgi:hypothetical protein